MSGEQHAQMTTLHSRPSDKYDDQNKQVQQEIHDALVQDLEDKERAIKQGLYFKPDRHVDSSINANPGNWICTRFYILKLYSDSQPHLLETPLFVLQMLWYLRDRCKISQCRRIFKETSISC